MISCRADSASGFMHIPMNWDGVPCPPLARRMIHQLPGMLFVALAAVFLGLWELTGLFTLFAKGYSPLQSLIRVLKVCGTLMDPRSWKWPGAAMLLMPLLFAGTIPLLGQGLQSALLGNGNRGIGALVLLYLLVSVVLLAWPALVALPGLAAFLEKGRPDPGRRHLNPLAAFVIALVLAVLETAVALLVRTGCEILYTAPPAVTAVNWLLLPAWQISSMALPVLLGSGMLAAGTLGLSRTLGSGMLAAGTLGLSRTVQRSPAAAVLGVAVSIVICLSVAWPDRPLMDRDAGIKPVVVAHRGYAHGVTENTLESFRAAHEAGAGVAELDVYQSADGGLYVSHDQSLERVTGTPLDLEQASAQEIKALRTKDGQAVPALKDVLTYAKESDLHLVIEIKSTSRAVDTARKTAELIRETGMGEQCSIAGFRHSVLAAAREVDPSMGTELLLNFAISDVTSLADVDIYSVQAGAITGFRHSVLAAAREVDPSMGTELLLNFAISDVTSLADVDIYSVQAGAITSEMIAQVHQAGKRIYAWTVNDPRQMEVLLAMGVDGLTTDDTPAAVQAIADYEERVGQ